jgi:hypothetical protein
MMSMPRHRWLLVGAAVLVAVGLLVWWAWPQEPPAVPRERQYLETTACLLTDDQGITGDQAAQTWAAMREVSDQKLIKVQYLSVSGPQTSANALSYFNTLGLQKCAAIIAVGDAPVAAMAEGGSRFPDVRLLAIGGQSPAGSIRHLDAPSKPAVQELLNSLLG